MQDNINGVYRSVVTSISDPTNKRRIRVKSPQIAGDTELNWAEPINPGAPIPSPGSIVWIMFNGGYLNKPVYLQDSNDDDLVWTTISPITGYTHNGNGEGTVKYTSYVFRGTRYVEWQGGLNVASTGSENSFTVPNGGTFFSLTDSTLFPSSTRTVLCAKNQYSSTNFNNNSIKIDFKIGGDCSLISSAAFSTTWVSLNGIRYVL